MYPYMNEDVAWQRMKDLQREAENSRLWARETPNLIELGVSLLTSALEAAFSLVPRRRPELVDERAAEARSDAA